MSLTGNYLTDCNIGCRLAAEFLEAGAPPHLQWIIADMPRELSGIEVGFLSVVGVAAAAGKAAGRCYMEQGAANMAAFELQTILVSHARRRRQAPVAP